MGQSLSCVSKQKKPDENVKRSGSKRLFKKQKVEIVVRQQDEGNKDVPISAVKGATTSAQPPTNHLQAETDAVRKRPKLVLLKPAPAKIKLPTPIPPQASANVSPSKTNMVAQARANRAAPGDIHNPQLVDQFAREIAKGEARPATWADLYWTLIENRNLKTDAEKIKALFSWLCSLPPDKDAFVTMDELEQGVKDGVQYAEQAKHEKAKSISADSPEIVVNDLIRGKVTYLRAFESLCRYASIPCCTIKGLAKGVDYTVGMKLTNQRLPPDVNDTSPITKIQHAWSAACVDGKWALFDSMWAAERLAMSATARQSQIAELGKMEYETDMFYFNADPAIFIHSHFPFENNWQLLDPPLTLEQFQNGVLLKPAFFTHGLGLFSHQEGVVPVINKLILKLSIPPSLVKTLLFTFNLKLEGHDEWIKGVKLSFFGMHEMFVAESLVVFNFRFPKSGAYKLTIYARKVGDPLFTDVCEYRIEAKGAGTEPGSDVTPGSIDIPPFPPTAQTSYGPTEKASELKVQPSPTDMPAVHKCANGVFQVRFVAVDSSVKLPRMTARLKSLLYEHTMLTDCILVRNVESSEKSDSPACVITSYLPSAGEYALEVYGAPADADEDTSYFLVWQFLIDADTGVQLPTPVRKQFSTSVLGPRDANWSKLGLQTISHPDPLIHVPTKGVEGMQKPRSKSELIQHYVEQTEKSERERMQSEIVRTEHGETEPSTTSGPVDETPGPKDCDLKIVLGKRKDDKLCIVAELVDISESTEVSKPEYLIQQSEEPTTDEKNLEYITYLIRIPQGDRFYKLHLYAAMVEISPAFNLPLVYTYIIEAPQRIMSAEAPYIGAKHGGFPEKLMEKPKAAGGDEVKE